MPRRQGRAPPGKLKAVACAWAGAGRRAAVEASDDALTQAVQLPEWLQRRDTSEPVEIEHLDAPLVALFLALDTQWRWHPMSALRTGVDYAAVPVVAGMLDIDVTPAIFAELRLMENAALGELARRAR